MDGTAFGDFAGSFASAAMHGTSEVEILVHGLRGALLRRCAVFASTHFQGLAVAARSLRTVLTPRMVKRLVDLDTTYNVCRHMDRVVYDEMVAELERAFSGHDRREPAAGAGPPELFNIFDEGVDASCQTEHQLPPTADVRLLRLDDVLFPVPMPDCDASEPLWSLLASPRDCPLVSVEEPLLVTPPPSPPCGDEDYGFIGVSPGSSPPLAPAVALALPPVLDPLEDCMECPCEDEEDQLYKCTLGAYQRAIDSFRLHGTDEAGHHASEVLGLLRAARRMCGEAARLRQLIEEGDWDQSDAGDGNTFLAKHDRSIGGVGHTGKAKKKKKKKAQFSAG